MFGGKKDQIQTIGFRHGEKLYESLLSTEERVKSEDLGGYFRVLLDSRDLNYSVYFEEGQPGKESLEAYTSHNTERLDIEAVKKLLLTIPEVRQELGN
jgi:UDP-glucose 4-epimerase